MVKQLVMVLSILTLFDAFALAQDKPEPEMKEKHRCMKDSSGCCAKHESHSEMKMEESKETELCSTIILQYAKIYNITI